MRILVHGLNFSPELTGVGKYTGEMVEWLTARGHVIHVVTAPPYYPEWRIKPGYARAWYTREAILPTLGNGTAGVVVRCPIYVPAKPTGWSRILHLISFALASLPPMLHALRWRPNVVLCIAPTLLAAPVSLICARLMRVPALLHIQDLEVDAALDLGILRRRAQGRAVRWFESSVMRRFDKVSTLTRNMAARICSKGVPSSKLLLFPNWVDTEAICPLDRMNGLRRTLNLSNQECVALYAGSMGRKQGLETVLEAAALLRDVPGIVFVLSGDGPARTELQAAASGLSNVRFLNLQPADMLNELLNLADVHVMPQKADAADLVMPSKLLGMFASGRPTVATARPETQVFEVVTGRGIVVPPEDPAALAAAVSRLAHAPSERQALGAAARDYAMRHWGKDLILRELEATLENILRSS